MTSAQMVQEFELGFDVLASGLAPGFEDAEVYRILNRSYDSIILDLYKAKDWTNLNTLVKRGIEYMPTTDTNGVQYIDLPSDYWLYCDSYTKLNRNVTDATTGFIQVTTQTNEYIDNDLINYTDSASFFETAYNKHRYFKKPKVFITNNRLYILADYFTTINNVTLLYVKERADIAVAQDCELQESLHRLVVDKAIDIAKTVINAQLPQSN